MSDDDRIEETDVSGLNRRCILYHQGRWLKVGQNHTQGTDKVAGASIIDTGRNKLNRNERIRHWL